MYYTVILIVLLWLLLRDYTNTIQVVIARYNENLSWVNTLDPKRFDVIVYNKGSNDTLCKFTRPVKIESLENKGRETDTYLRHIYTHYENLPRHIVFTQGDPFEHNYNFLNDLKRVDLCEKFHHLSRYYMIDLPESVRCAAYLTEPGIYTMECREGYVLSDAHPIRDQIPNTLFIKYRKVENIMYQFSQEIDVPFDENQMTLDFFWSGMFHTHVSNIYKYPKEQYKKWIDLNNTDVVYGYLFERMWYYLFAL